MAFMIFLCYFHDSFDFHVERPLASLRPISAQTVDGRSRTRSTNTLTTFAASSSPSLDYRCRKGHFRKRTEYLLGVASEGA